MLIFYERTVLLTGWYLVAGADLVWENNTDGWFADKPNEYSESPFQIIGHFSISICIIFIMYSDIVYA